MRHPSFKGLREDKAAAEVVLELPEQDTQLITKKKKNSLSGTLLKAGKNERRSLLNPTEKTQVKTIQGHELTFNNLNKIYWPDEKITKRDVLNYYYQAAPFILPYLVDRPQSMNRHVNGITGKSFYQKDVTGKAPDWVRKMPYHSEADERDKNFLVCDGEASLLYMAGLGCIELNPWHSKQETPDAPDWCVIDLDPGTRTDFEQVIKTAQEVYALLSDLKVKSYCKTSGSTGLHIYIPLGGKYSYEQSKEFARILVTLIHEQLPEFTSIERAVKNRKGKMYLDFLQNRPQATIAAPYSLRPKPGATVSMPLHWEEVKKGLKMKDFTIKNAIERMKAEGDLFKPVLGKGIDLLKVLNQL